MDKSQEQKKIEILETKIRHLTNDYALTKDEYDRTTAEYLEILNEVRAKNEELQVLKLNLEKIVDKRTKELQESEEKFKNLFEHSYDPLAVFDTSFDIINVNHAFCRMTGYSRDQLLTMNILAFPRDKYLKNLKNALEMTSVIGENNHETLFVRSNGENVNIRLTVKVIDPEKKLIQGIFRDVTDLVMIEEALKLSETRNRELFNNMSSGAVVFEATEDGSNFIIKDVNKASERLENIKKIDVVGRKVTEVFPGVEVFGLLKVFKKVWSGSIPMHHPVSYYKDNRIKGWRENYVYKLPNGELVAVYDDVTERKQAEEALINSERKFRMMSENITDTIAIYQDEKFCWVNNASVKFCGLPNKDIIGKSLHDLLPPESADELTEAGNSKEGLETPREVEIPNRNEGSSYVEVQGIDINYENRKAVQFVFHDITERKKHEKQLKAALNEKEVLLSEVLHRVKNNLQVISSLLTFQYDTIDDQKYRDIFTESIKRVESMAYIHEMLYQSDSFAELDMENYVRRLSNNLLNTYRQDGRDIRIDISVEGLLLNMKAAIPCGLILNELISNSLKYAFTGKESGLITINMNENRDNMITLIVSDDGIGFSKKDRAFKNNTLGLDLIYLLGENQLKGTVNISSEIGTKCNLKFKRREQN